MRLDKSWAVFAFLFGALSGYPANAAAQIPVDVELLFAIDISGSINTDETAVQRDGVAAALRSQDFTASIRAGPRRSIAVAVLGYADVRDSRLLMDWRILREDGDAIAFADELIASRWMPGRRTSMSGGMDIAARSVETNEFDGTRKMILFFGDGTNNFGRPLEVARDGVLALGITVAGMPIAVMPRPENFPDLDRYFASCVAGGEGAFVLLIRSWQDVVTASRQALNPTARDPNMPFIFEQLGTGRECNSGGGGRLIQWPPNAAGPGGRLIQDAPSVGVP